MRNICAACNQVMMGHVRWNDSLGGYVHRDGCFVSATSPTGTGCPKCQSVYIHARYVSNDFECDNCGHTWVAVSDPLVGKPSVDVGFSLDYLKDALNNAAPKDRQALYEYLRNVHGCRIW